MTTSHRTVWILLAAGLVAAGCDSSSGESSPTTTEPAVAGTPTTEAVLLESADGVVQFEVPAGAVLEGTELAIEIVDPAGVPGIEGTTPIGSAYRLTPTDLAFADTLPVTYRLPLEDTGRSAGIPLVYTVLERDGEARRTIEQRSELAGTELRHLFEIDRFGTLVLLDGGVDLTLDPEQVADLGTTEAFEATLTAVVSAGSIEPGYDIESRWLASGAVSTEAAENETIEGFGVDGDAEWVTANDFRCSSAGGGTYTAELSVRVSATDTTNRQIVVLAGEATCGDVGR